MIEIMFSVIAIVLVSWFAFAIYAAPGRFEVACRERALEHAIKIKRTHPDWDIRVTKNGLVKINSKT